MPWGALEGRELIGKYNSLSSKPKRSKDTTEGIKAIATVLIELAKEIGRIPSQVAINWVRQTPYQMIPIIGARTEKQLKDNLGCIEF